MGEKTCSETPEAVIYQLPVIHLAVAGFEEVYNQAYQLISLGQRTFSKDAHKETSAISTGHYFQFSD